MKTRARLSLVSVFPAVALMILAACADRPGEDTARETGSRPVLGKEHAHLLRVPQKGGHARVKGAASGESSSNAHMTYRGGPVISHVKVFTVYWNASVPNQS